MTYVLNLDDCYDIGESDNLMELAQCMATMLWTFPRMESDALAVLYDDEDVEEGYQEVVIVTERTNDHLTLDIDGILTSFPRPYAMTQ